MFEALLNSQIGINLAADIITDGHVVAMQVQEIFGLFADAANKEAVRELQRIKGEGKKPLAVIMHAEDALFFADVENIEEATLEALYDAKRRAGGRTHIRIPVHESHLDTIPVAVHSREEGVGILQFLDPTGIQPLTMLVDELKKRDIHFLAASSMNKKGQKVITDIDSAIKFYRKHRIRLLLRTDLALHANGGNSFPIVSFIKNGSGKALGIRSGDYAEALCEALGVEIDWQ